ncbi:hypothetical protein BSF41_47250 [Flavobacterium sp. ACN2]|uniref:hypothetical protein n=1 Tax=Flavobacterium sp. ACN2 TaxID=1975676 RepID=UPI000BB356DE|nr:hypothetical protein [Flavobacterium sp. ACN2]PBI82764.1 hypothetical protein BSF41_47250 [Flavobacterium sp. ACN2]
MKKMLVFLLLFSCNSKSDKPVKLELPTICITEIGYHEARYSPSPPAVFFTFKITDSIISKRIEKNKLTQVFLYSMSKEDQEHFHFNAMDKVYKNRENSYSFFVRTAVFSVTSVRKNKKWKNDEIKKILNGDVGLVFGLDTIRVKSCPNKKIIIDVDMSYKNPDSADL